jgi:ABC-type transport system involved in multi-copper enzyme maturation permease subunit
MKILTIALNTFKECIRDKILYNLLIFAMLMIGLSAFLSKLTIGVQIRIVKDIGLGSISIFGVLIAIFLGIGLVSKEIDRRTIYTILSKPVQRYLFLLGKFAGLLLTLFINIAVMTVALIILIYSMGGDVNLLLFEAIFLIFIELIVVTSIALFFSTFTTPTLSAIFTLSFFVIGHLTGYIRLFGTQSDLQFVRKLSDILYYVLPNLESFNIKSMVMYAEALEWNLFFLSTMYGLIYASLVLVLSVIIFQKRDFK